MNSDGLLLCSRYALPPNSLHYCGPDKITNLFAYTKEQIADRGLQEILTEFETLYSYLSFIAYENNIRDPFDKRVVEAYWLGNSLLNTISLKGFYKHFSESLHLTKRLKKKDFNLLIGKLPAGAIPHHTFHVLNIFTRTGHHALKHTLETMDNCRIGWGKVLKFSIINDQLSMNKKNVQMIKVLSKPLLLKNGKLALGRPVVKQIFFPNLKLHATRYTLHDQWVSFHWNQFCDFVTPTQVANLERYTQVAISLANKTI